MMKRVLAITALATPLLVAIGVDARRLGGERNPGMQRSAPAAPQKVAAGTPAQMPVAGIQQA